MIMVHSRTRQFFLVFSGFMPFVLLLLFGVVLIWWHYWYKGQTNKAVQFASQMESGSSMEHPQTVVSFESEGRDENQVPTGPRQNADVQEQDDTSNGRPMPVT